MIELKFQHLGIADAQVYFIPCNKILRGGCVAHNKEHQMHFRQNQEIVFQIHQAKRRKIYECKCSYSSLTKGRQ